MEILLSRLESLPTYKDVLKVWCRQNGIKVSFLVNMTLSKSKSIHSKLVKTYSNILLSYAKSVIFEYKWRVILK